LKIAKCPNQKYHYFLRIEENFRENLLQSTFPLIPKFHFKIQKLTHMIDIQYIVRIEPAACEILEKHHHLKLMTVIEHHMQNILG